MATHVIESMAIEVDGDGPAVLCIHGLGGSSNTWTPLMGAFAHHKVIRPDLPGSGRSPMPQEPLSIDLYVGKLKGLLDAMALDAVHVVAHSLGSIVAQHLAVSHPKKVKSLALFGPLACPPDEARPNILARASLAREGVAAMQEIADAIVTAATSRETKQAQPAVLALVRESVMRQAPQAYAGSCEALAHAESAQLEVIRVPTLLVTGDQDGVAPPANVQALSARIAGSRVVVLPGCGHWTTFEQPQACLDELQAFHQSLR